MTIFIAGSISFAYLGLTNILKIRDEAKQTESIRKETELIFKDATEKVSEVDRVIPKMEARIDAEIEKLRTKVDFRIVSVDTQVKDVTSQLKSIPDASERG